MSTKCHAWAMFKFTGYCLPDIVYRILWEAPPARPGHAPAQGQAARSIFRRRPELCWPELCCGPHGLLARIDVRSPLFSIRRTPLAGLLAPPPPGTWAVSSVRQSTGLLIRVSWVRPPHGPLCPTWLDGRQYRRVSGGHFPVCLSRALCFIRPKHRGHVTCPWRTVGWSWYRLGIVVTAHTLAYFLPSCSQTPNRYTCPNAIE